MRKYGPIALIALASFGACGGSSDQADQAAAQSPAAKAGEVAAGQDLGCDFAKEVPTPAPAGQAAAEMTQADVDEAVASSPAEIRGDVQVILSTLLDMQTKSKAIQGLPPQEAAMKAQETFAMTQSPAYLESSRRYGEYLTQHCPGLAKALESATTSTP